MRSERARRSWTCSSARRTTRWRWLRTAGSRLTTRLVLPALDPGRVYQWGTLVTPEHRGHRLGLALKAANLAQLQAAHPEPLLLTTYNAEVNSHMIGINERLGFRPVERLGEFQKKMLR